MSQPLVLAIEPDLRQAAIVKRIVKEKGLADIVVVDSRDAAIEAMRTSMPDVLLLSALLSPRDEDELIAHLKTREHAGHLQMHSIPQLASSLGSGEERAARGLLSAFRRKKEAEPVAGCDPDLFADEIRVYLQQAADKKHQLQHQPFAPQAHRPEPAAAASAHASATAAETDDVAETASAWASPFEWKPSTSSSSRSARPREEAPARKPAPVPAPPPPPTPEPEPLVSAPLDTPSVIKPAVEEPLIVQPAMAAAAAEPVVEKAPAPVVEKRLVAEPVVAEPVVTRPLVSEKVGQLVEPAPPKKHAKSAEAARPKPVADRPAKLTGSQLQDLIRKHAASDRTGRDGLGPLARWARSDAPRATKAAAVSSDDVRALIGSLAVPAAVASVSYAHGVRIRRVRVPVSADQDGAIQASA